jgi:hypothetical protein
MRCPGCDSEQTRKLAAVWEEGSYTEVSTAKTTVKGQSNYFGGGQMGVISNRQMGTTRTTTSGMTELAKRAARPSPETPFGMWRDARGRRRRDLSVNPPARCSNEDRVADSEGRADDPWLN